MMHKQLPEAEENGNGSQFPTWKIVAFAAATIAGFWMALWIQGADADIKQLKKEKIDESRYCEDIRRIEGKIDKLINFHMKNGE